MSGKPERKPITPWYPQLDGELDLEALRLRIRKELEGILSQAPNCTLLVESSIRTSLTPCVAAVSAQDWFKERGASIATWNPGPISVTSSHVVFIVRPTFANVQILNAQINGMRRMHRRSSTKFHVYFTPRCPMLVQRWTEDAGLRGELATMKEVAIDLIPFDRDICTLQAPRNFREMHVHGDFSILYVTARSLIQIMALGGAAPRVVGKGEMADRTMTLLNAMLRSQTRSFLNAQTANLETVVILDRTADLVTPLVSPSNYEAQIDECMGIQDTLVRIEKEIKTPGSETKSQTTQKKMVSYPLNNNDTVYDGLRSMHITEVGSQFSKISAELKEVYDAKEGMGRNTPVDVLYEFMQKFKAANAKHIFLQTHVKVAEEVRREYDSPDAARRREMEQYCLEEACSVKERRIKHLKEQDLDEFIDEMIGMREPLYRVMRFCCLYSQLIGFTPKRFAAVHRALLRAYGYDELFSLQNLFRLDMFRPLPSNNSNEEKSAGKTLWTNLNRCLRCMDERPAYERKSSSSESTVFDGYVPLSVKLTQTMLGHGWKPRSLAATLEAVRDLPGPTFSGVLQSATTQPGGVAQWKVQYARKCPDLVPGPNHVKRGVPSVMEMFRSSGHSSSSAGNVGGGSSGSGKRLVCVYFVGGVTYGEIAVFRLLSLDKAHPYTYLVCATHIINGNQLILEVLDKMNSGLQLDSDSGTDHSSTTKNKASK